MKNYEVFLNSFMECWKNLDPEGIYNLISKKCEYYENPIDKPTTDYERIKDLWKIIPNNQKNISYNGKILFQDNKSCVYHFVMQRTMVGTNKTQNIDGIFEIKLNNNNLLTYFKQWRYTNEV